MVELARVRRVTRGLQKQHEEIMTKPDEKEKKAEEKKPKEGPSAEAVEDAVDFHCEPPPLH